MLAMCLGRRLGLGCPRWLDEVLAMLAGAEAVIIFIDQKLRVEVEIFGIGAKEALDVSARGQHVEILVLHRLDVFYADLGFIFRTLQGDIAAYARVPQRCPDLKHRIS